jgi:hypothetical protein
LGTIVPARLLGVPVKEAPMATTLTVHDRATDGMTLHELTLEFLTERVTVRELIRSRVYQEVTEYNARRVTRWAGLVQPESDPSATLHGQQPHRIDWEAQFQRALRAFSTRVLVIIVDGHQVEELDNEIEIRVDTSVTFLRLVPLIGG